jgi:DNA-binding transcriptional MerR regulator
MATNNIRVVGYLPPLYHEKLREYMQSQSLTESAAIVAIVRQFFDGESGSERVASQELDEVTAPLKAQIALIERRLAVLESAFVSSQHSRSAKRAPYQGGPPPVLTPQNITQLAQRLGVSAATLEEAAQKSEDEFRDWSRRRDPAKRSWRKKGELFHPNSD